jgi:hypothetical protein
MLTGEELLAGSQLDFDIAVPAEVLNPSPDANGELTASSDRQPANSQVRLKPLTINDLQLITKAAKDNDALTAVLMVQKSLVEPALSIAEVNAMHIGLLQYLLHQVNDISGINATETSLAAAVEAPLTRATYLLAKSFGWTPQQVHDMTLGQVLLNLHMLKEQENHVDHNATVST